MLQLKAWSALIWTYYSTILIALEREPFDDFRYKLMYGSLNWNQFQITPLLSSSVLEVWAVDCKTIETSSQNVQYLDYFGYGTK